MMAIISAVFISLIPAILNLIGFGLLKRDWVLNILLALAAGTLLGEVWFHALPEAVETSSEPLYVFYTVLAGIMGFFVFESLLHTYLHKFEKEDWALAGVNLLSDGLHNFVDGILIAAAFSISLESGIAASIAIALHEIPQEIGDIAILKKAGLSKTNIYIWNLLSGITAVIGVMVGLAVNQTSEGSNLLISLATGGFMYMALSNLLPEIKHQHSYRKLLLHLLAIGLGLVIMFALKIFLEIE